MIYYKEYDLIPYYSWWNRKWNKKNWDKEYLFKLYTQVKTCPLESNKFLKFSDDLCATTFLTPSLVLSFGKWSKATPSLLIDNDWY